MVVQKKKQSVLINTSISIIVIALAFWYLSSGAPSKPTTTTSVTQPKVQSAGDVGKQMPVPAQVGTNQSAPSAKPVDELPAAFPADRIVRTEPPTDVVLPPDLQRQLDAPPPQLPDDLKAQLDGPPPELPEDLKAQLNAPPPEIPDDIKRAMQTPPRIVTIDEVNNPDLIKQPGSVGK